VEAVPESPPVVPRISECWGEDGGVNDEHVPCR
jgi:hypothetical protein